MTHDETLASEALAAIKAIIRRGIMTLLTLRDPDKKYQRGFKDSAWLFPVINTAQEAYGYSNYGFEPTPHDLSQLEIVAGWLSWLRRTEGEGAIRRLIAWTLGIQTWKIGSRERCSERTIRNRIDRSVAAIIREFAAVDIQVEMIEYDRIPKAMAAGKEIGLPPAYSMIFAPPPGPHGGQVVLRKVYIHDKGFMIGGREVRDGRDKLRRVRAVA